MAKDLYAVLGLSRDASPEELKRAYRRLSKEWHPDKHKGDKAAEERFKEINEAYEVLTNPERKRMYDQFGTVGNGAPGGQGYGGFNFNGFDFGGGQGGIDLGDIFGSFFGSHRRQAAQQEGADRETDVALDMADVLHAVEKKVRVHRFVTCTACSGEGGEPGSEIVTCTACGGTGQVTTTVQSFFGQIRQQSVCTVCGGSGKVPSAPCRACAGEGRVEATDELTITVPAGIENGQTLRIRGKGDSGRRKAAAGDLFVQVRVRPDPRFRRDGADMYAAIGVPAIDVILGAEVEVETVQGKTTVKIPAGTQPNQVMRLRGKGLPVLGSSRFGDHYVTVNVEIPTKLSRKEKGLLEEWRKARE